MENKKLLKFLYKDIAEIEELFIEKGSEGFDEYEIEFIQSRFTGAKQIIQIFSEKENKRLKSMQSHSHSQIAKENGEGVALQTPAVNEDTKKQQPGFTAEEQESLNSLSEFEEELKESEQVQVEEEVVAQTEQIEPLVAEAKNEAEESKSQQETLNEINVVNPKSASNTNELESSIAEAVPNIQDTKPEVDLNDEPEVDEANHRLGDSFAKEKSVNELLAGESNKLEHKISNSPVASIKTAIGINDRYQYIRELFDGNAETFSKAVSELDNLNSINEAVTYLQQNYKWKKNDTSLKFVNLVKRRFPNE
jgi:hypothetical protein